MAQITAFWALLQYVTPTSLWLLSVSLRAFATGHSDAVRALATSHDKLFSGSYDGTVKVWDIETLECLKTLAGHTGPVRTLVLSAGNMFSGSYDKTVSPVPLPPSKLFIQSCIDPIQFCTLLHLHFQFRQFFAYSEGLNTVSSSPSSLKIVFGSPHRLAFLCSADELQLVTDIVWPVFLDLCFSSPGFRKCSSLCKMSPCAASTI